MSRLCCYWLCPYSDGRGESGSPSSGGSVDDEGGGSLSITSAISALLSFIVVAIAVSTGQWLLTEEKLPRLVQHLANASTEPDIKLTYSGLWRVCVAVGSNAEYECSTIDYFPQEEYSPDPSDSTMAIPYAVTKSAVFFLAATALLVIAEVCYLAGHLARPKPSLCVFIAGVILIISGLLMLVGMIMYISIFKAEVGSKLRPRSSFQGPPFVYRYGYSFLLYVSGFITTEFAGTTAIFLHISWQQLELIRECSKRKYQSRNACHLDNHHVHATTNNVYGSFHLCERHQKKYFCERETIDPHHHHRRHHHHHHHHHHLEYEEYLPTPPDCNHYHPGMTHDLTTETVSTIADVLHDEYALGMQHEFVTFDLSENLPPLPETVRNSGWKSNSFKKTTPV
ncbi:PREDICTED: voltage-dependent calcium channel gamma-3 subunit [Ceratosolen solmsi marchali]|uniref:Voltage-dependent calcium channel gamma-3 subunit n=1 Tax=Ceratosolen solmsi marchali TaxID=326594 RepID=A0AAJ6YGT5_9HYME|nr:PREDICTED: voltage-dependent calcium channel gamma-3 subunit [Ceratosolen solmsi marchali]